jgi:two-component system NarL family sensor kinase
MLSQQNTGWLILVYGTAVALIFIVFILLFLFNYQRRMLQHQQDLRTKDEDMKLAQLDAAMQAQEREQKRIASELHDGIGAELSALKLMLRNVGFKTQKKEDVYNDLMELVDIIDNTIEQVRAISHSLIPRVLEDLGLVNALQEMCNRINKAQPNFIGIYIQGNEQIDIPIDKQLLIYRMVQELVQNAIKHAQARSLYILLQFSPHEFVANVTDDGKGFDTNASGFKHGVGLKNIESRALLLPAIFTFESEPNKGTRASIVYKL